MGNNKDETPSILNQVVQGECSEVMSHFPSESVDLTVISPPYDDLRNYKGYSFNFEEVAKELYRITKKGGVVVWVVGDKTDKGSETGTSFKQALYFMRLGFSLHDTMIYEKVNPTPARGNRYQQSFEYMFVFSKGKPKTFNPILAEKKYKESRSNKYYNKDKHGVQQSRSYNSKSDFKVINNIWSYTVGLNNTTKDKIAFRHPAVFPERLAEDHIISWSNEGDIVLDCFCGSGTTLKMAHLNNRGYIGIDYSEDYVSLSKERLSQYVR